MDEDDQAHVGPPDLILQAIVPLADAPAEIRAAVAHSLANQELVGQPKYTWEDIGFAASVIALVEGTNQRAKPDTQWAFALTADSPKPGEQIHSTGGWSKAIGQTAFSSGGARQLWRASVFAAIKTEPRSQ